MELQSGEKLKHETETRKNSVSGDLAVTSNRLLYAQDSGLQTTKIDLDIQRIDEIEYKNRRLNPWYFGFGILICIIPFVLAGFPPQGLPIWAFLLILGLGLLVIVVSVLLSTSKLVVRTPSNKHTFRGGDLEGVHHAIRN